MCKTKKTEEIKFIDVEDQDDTDDDDEICVDADDDGHTDEEELSDTSDEEEDESDYNPGDIVWARHGRIGYPAQIQSLVDLPEHLQARFQRQRDTVVVQCLGRTITPLLVIDKSMH